MRTAESEKSRTSYYSGDKSGLHAAMVIMPSVVLMDDRQTCNDAVNVDIEMRK
jgi:hypothetical protein